MDQTTTVRPADAQPAPRPDLIAIRKSCDTEGTGLSHFVLMDKEAAK
ncbi:MAG: modified peptide precursor CbpA [Bacteroidales bacterium]|nr:modified peptide precursor CbpA [Bacteroidales bacterium]